VFHVASVGLALQPRAPAVRRITRRQFHRLIVGIVGDVDVAGGVHRHTTGIVEARERSTAWVLDPAASFSTRLLPQSAR